MHPIQIEEATLLSTYLRSIRMPLKMSCGGHGSCKTCRVLLDGEPVLACQTEVTPDTYTLAVPQSNTDSGRIQIDLEDIAHLPFVQQPRTRLVEVNITDEDSAPNTSNRERLVAAIEAAGEAFPLHPDLLSGQRADTCKGTRTLRVVDGIVVDFIQENTPPVYGIGVDIGTTTVAAAIVDLSSQKIVASGGRLNAQYAYAEDLVARISFCHSLELLNEMQELILRRTLRPLLKDLLKDAAISPESISHTVLSGNAPMIHILLGMDPTGMGGWPFNAVDLAPLPRPASSLRLPGRTVECIPAKSAYLGGDIVSGLAQIDFENQPDGTLFVDLGTNAEMALKANGQYLCTAVPAGPSFEGGGFPCGISAIPGAIDAVWDNDGALEFSTIGQQDPIGICGSGIIAFVAAAFRAGILRKKGRFSRRCEAVSRRELLGQSQRVYAFSEEVYVSEDDISNFLQAKAAVFSGIRTLCRVAGVDVFDLHQLILAGNFGKRVRLENLTDIGIIPPLPKDRITVVGNTSLKGALYSVIDATAAERAQRLTDHLKFVELNAEPGFQDDFINALFIPHLTLDFSTLS